MGCYQDDMHANLTPTNETAICRKSRKSWLKGRVANRHKLLTCIYLWVSLAMDLLAHTKYDPRKVTAQRTSLPELTKTYLTIEATWARVTFRIGMKLTSRGITAVLTVLLTLLKKMTMLSSHTSRFSIILESRTVGSPSLQKIPQHFATSPATVCL